MYHSVFLFLLFSEISALGWCANEGNVSPGENLTDIYLINPLPYADNGSSAGWDRGFELVPAGQLAKEQINNRSDILPGYRLNLINIDSEACGISLITDGLVNFFGPLMDPNVLSVGVVGLFCSSVTNAIAPVAGHPGIDYIQVAGSTSPVHRNLTKYPRLFHTISSSNVFNDAAFKLMELFNWENVNVMHDSLGVYFRTTAQNFISRLRRGSLLSQTPIGSAADIYSTAFENLRLSGGGIVYGSLTVPQAAKVMCEAHNRKFIWPAYAYIFHERNLDELIEEVMENSKVPCNVTELKEALEGTFSLQYRLELDDDTTLESGINYSEYKSLYSERLRNFSFNLIKRGIILTNLTDNGYANVLYDEVWAFALALNHSLDLLDSMNLTLDHERYGFGDVAVSDVIQEQLANLSFQGASGLMQFNRDHESRTSVNIFQVQNGKSVLVAIYLPYEGKLQLLEKEEFLPDGPEDTFELVYELVGLVYAVVIFVISGLCYVLTTVILVMFIYWRKQPEIKASSPYLSLTMFAGCYLLITATVVRTLNRFSVSVIENTTTYDVLCNIEIWFAALGFNVIYSTLFIRLLRIFYVFNRFRKTSKYWADQYLLLGVLVVMSPQLVALVVWTATDHVRRSITTPVLRFEDPPYYETRATCDSGNFNTWVLSISVYDAIVISLVTLFAVQTRHIKRENFKDTKKVNIFVATTITMVVIFVILWYVFRSVGYFSLSHFFYSIATLSIPLDCQLFLFVPKTLPQLFKRPKRYSTVGSLVPRQSRQTKRFRFSWHTPSTSV